MTDNKIEQSTETETKEEIKTETSAENMTDEELVASLNRVYAPEEIEAAYVEAEKEEEPDPELSDFYPVPYYVKDNCLGYTKIVKGGEVQVQLCNFVPRISCEVLYDDGEEVTREYEITVLDENGELLPPFRVPAQSFAKLDWVGGNLPARCSLDVTGSVEKHVVRAVKGTASRAELRYIFAHTGWVRRNGDLHFLLPGSPFCEVELTGKCANYGMVCEEDPADLGILTALMQLEIVPPDVLLPLMSLVFLSPLNSLLRKAGHEPKFVFTLIGRTGAKKSTLSALALSFFGMFSESDLPMSFADTPNSILLAASHLDDVLTCVDDSHPSTKQDVTNMNTIAEKLVRGYRNGVAHYSRPVSISIARQMELVNHIDMGLTKYILKTCGWRRIKNVSEMIKFRRRPQTAGLPDTGVVCCVLPKTERKGDAKWQNAERTAKGISENEPTVGGKEGTRRDAIPSPESRSSRMSSARRRRR